MALLSCSGFSFRDRPRFCSRVVMVFDPLGAVQTRVPQSIGALRFRSRFHFEHVYFSYQLVDPTFVLDTLGHTSVVRRLPAHIAEMVVLRNRHFSNAFQLNARYLKHEGRVRLQVEIRKILQRNRQRDGLIIVLTSALVRFGWFLFFHYCIFPKTHVARKKAFDNERICGYFIAY